MKKLITFIILFCSISFLSYGQKYRNSGLFIDGYLTQGGVIKSNDFLRGENREGEPVKSYSATDLRLGWQTLGTQTWHHHLNMPYYGLGLHSVVFSNEDEIGFPTALYFFFGAPFVRKNNTSFDYEFSFGLSHNWKPYDHIDNPFNIAVGSYENAYIDVKLKYLWYFSKRLALDANLRFTHFSNGALKLPNKGINLIAPSLGLRFDIIPKDIQPIERDLLEENRLSEELNVLISLGKRSVRDTDTPNQATASLVNLSVDYLKPVSQFFKVGPGLDLGIDENRNLLIDGDNVTFASRQQQIYAGVSALGQFRANRLGVQGGIGFDVINGSRTHFFQNFYQKIGLRYYFFQKVFVGINIKSRYFKVADYIEWSVGYSIL